MRRLATMCCLVAVLGPTGTLRGQEPTRLSGWQARLDAEGPTRSELARLVDMPPGWHVKQGPAGIFWHPDMHATGAYLLEMEVFLFDPDERREPFGLFLGGRDLEGAGPSYAEFVLREGGQFSVGRFDAGRTRAVLPWKGHDAILSYRDRGAETAVRNVLVVEAGPEIVRFLVNGEEVARLARTELAVDGVFGLRVSRALDLHVSRLEARPIR